MLPVLSGNRIRGFWNDPIESMHRELDQIFNRAVHADIIGDEWVGAYPMDVREDDDYVYVEAELPGFNRDEINLTLEAGMLMLTAERKSEEKKGTSHLTERRFTKVQRSFTLPTSVDENKVEASLSDGVLHIKLTKREEVKPKRIEVK